MIIIAKKWRFSYNFELLGLMCFLFTGDPPYYPNLSCTTKPTMRRVHPRSLGRVFATILAFYSLKAIQRVTNEEPCYTGYVVHADLI